MAFDDPFLQNSIIFLLGLSGTVTWKNAAQEPSLCWQFALATGHHLLAVGAPVGIQGSLLVGRSYDISHGIRWGY